MAEIKKLICDMCGRDIKDGYVFKPSSRRRIHGGTTSSGAYRFDLCDACLSQIQEACRSRKEAQAWENARTAMVGAATSVIDESEGKRCLTMQRT